MSYLAGLRNNDIDHWYTLRVSSWPIGACCRRVAILSMRAADAPDQAYGSVVAASKLFQYLLPPLQLSSMTTYFMIKTIFIYLLHISINVLFLGPPRGGSEKNGSGRPCSAPGKMRVDKVWRAGSLLELMAAPRIEGVVGRFLWRLRLCHPCATASARNRSRWQKFQKLDNQSKFSKERFSRSKLCRLAFVRLLPHKAEVEGRRRLQLQFPDAKLCRQQANGTTGRCFESWASENTKKMQLNPCSCPAQGLVTPPLGAGLQPRLWPRSQAGETASAPSQTAAAKGK